MSTDSRAPELTRSGLVLGEETVPLFMGSVHPFALEPAAWPAALAAVRTMGIRVVDACVPWAEHERTSGEIDFGASDPRLDIGRFVALAGELGLLVSLRIGPAQSHDRTRLGIPEPVIWDPECQARSAEGKPIVLPTAPLAFPLPSLASEKYLAEMRRWALAVGAQIAPLCHPRGPVVACHVDPGGAPFVFDHHPSALERYRSALERKGKTQEAIVRALASAAFADSGSIDAEREAEGWLRDFVEVGEAIRNDAVRALRSALETAGVSVPILYEATLDARPALPESRRAAAVLDLSALGPSASPERRRLDAAASAHAARAAARALPALARVGAGFSPFSRPRTEAESLNDALFALAHGISGVELYQAVESERWIGAPCDRSGVARPFADAWTRLARALEVTRFAELERVVAVRIVRSRALAPLLKAARARLPVAAELEELVLGARVAPPVTRALEDALELERFVFCLEDELERRHVPHAVVDDDDVLPFGRARLTIVVGTLEPGLRDVLHREAARGHAVVLAPFAGDSAEAAVDAPIPVLGRSTVQLGPALDDAIRTLGLPRFEAGPEELGLTVHADASGQPRVLFAFNRSARPLAGRLDAFGANVAEDLLDGSTFEAQGGTLSLPVPERTVRFLHLRD